MQCVLRTLILPIHTRLNGLEAFPEFQLCAAQLGEGAVEMLEFVVELFFDLKELWGGEGSEVDCELCGKSVEGRRNGSEGERTCLALGTGWVRGHGGRDDGLVVR